MNKSVNIFDKKNLTISLASGVIQDVIFESLQRKYDKRALKFLYQYNRIGNAMLATALLYILLKEERS